MRMINRARAARRVDDGVNVPIRAELVLINGSTGRQIEVVRSPRKAVGQEDGSVDLVDEADGRAALLTREGVRERPVERVQLVTLGSCGSTVASTAPMESRDHAPGALLPWWVRKVVASPWRDTQAIFVELKDIGLPPATGARARRDSDPARANGGHRSPNDQRGRGTLTQACDLGLPFHPGPWMSRMCAESHRSAALLSL